MNKKGFTLIELLAVIVILAILALIAVPIVLNIIEDSKESTTIMKAEFYLEAVDVAVKNSKLEGKKVVDGEYKILENGNICLSYEEDDDTICKEQLEIDVKGDVPKIGTVTITNGKIDEVSFVLNTKEITKNSKGQLVYVKTLDEVCEYKEGTKGEISSKYECKVDPNKDVYTFYILSYLDANGDIIKDKTNAISVNLIMDQNINSDGTPARMTGVVQTENPNKYNLVAWINQGDYESAGGKNWNAWADNNTLGPVTALNFLSEATKTWTNTNEIKISTVANEDGKSYIMPKTYTIYARMPIYLSEATKTEVADKTEATAYLYDNLDSEENAAPYGYWTLSPYSGFSNYVWNVKSSGIVYNYGVIGVTSSFGVRPVINLKLN